MTIISTTVGNNFLEGMSIPYSQQKRLKCSAFMQSQNRMILVLFQNKAFNIKIIQVYSPTSNAEEAEVEWFYEELQDLLELTPIRISFLSQGTGMQK